METSVKESSVTVRQRSEVRDGMRIEWHVPIQMSDGVVLRADVYRPTSEVRSPAILSYGPYAKGLSFQSAYPIQWEKMVREHPDVVADSSNKYQNWEVVDPEKWVPDGYACVRVDSRGAGWSPGLIDVWSLRETKDLFECIEWAALQPWCTGKVGLCGISYYAINQWQVAGLQPPHLAAMVAWEGAADFYRDVNYHGGILSEFVGKWYPKQVSTVQYGLGELAMKNPNTGESVAGPVTLSEDERASNRRDLMSDVRSHPFDDEWHRERSADWPRVMTPFLSAANWGGAGLHLRGNIEAFMLAASDQKWLEVHGLEHWTEFYTRYGHSLQKRFFNCFLKGVEDDWSRQPKVQLQIRHIDRFVQRAENEWPLARTKWTKYYLNSGMQLATEPAASEATVTYEALGEGVTFWMSPMESETEITGPIAVKLFASSSTSDSDFFIVMRVFDPTGNEVVFQGALDPNTPIAQGWLRASHRALDHDRSLPFRPYHKHLAAEPLTPGEVYELDVEVWPTCIVVPRGYQVALTVRGKDYEFGGDLGEFAKTFHYASKGCGPFVHADPVDRPAEVFGGTVTIHAGGRHQSYLLVPIIPDLTA